MLTEDYKVRLDAFEGPLDLLLHLIRRAEVEITDIPIAEITEQYLHHVREIEQVDIDLAGEFLVMAATLMEIKSRMIAPPERQGDLDELAGGEGEQASAGDPRRELIEQLMQYKRSREAALTLAELQREWELRAPTGRMAINREAVAEAARERAEADLDDLDLYDIVEAFERIVETVDFTHLGEHHVHGEDDVPLEAYVDQILERLVGDGARGGVGRVVSFRSLFAEQGRMEMIGLFIATLELVRRGAVRVLQDDLESDVCVELVDAARADVSEGADGFGGKEAG